MKLLRRLPRRRFLGRGFAAVGALVLEGCDKLSHTEWFPKVLGAGEGASRSVQRTLLTRKSMAQEFSEKDLSPSFRSNGTSEPQNPQYIELAKGAFADYRLKIDGLVDKPANLSMQDLRAMSSRTQITRHDCVEGWSAIAKWKGARLTAVLQTVGVKPNARYVVFHCADPMEADGTSPYYESIDMDDAYHVQTILAYALNDAALPIKNGAPIRLRVERQLGYKHAKYVMRLELVESLSHIGEGHGGYWEDQGYQWYAGV